MALRRKLWPLIEDGDLWLRNNRTGFATLPRAMPIILTIMDGMTKGKRVLSTYLDLWCRVMDEMFVQLQSPSGMAFAAGFEGGRAVRGTPPPGEVWTAAYRVKHGDGYYLWFEIPTRGVYDEITGKILREVSVGRDITERKENELRINAARIGYHDLLCHLNSYVRKPHSHGKVRAPGSD